MINPRRFEKNPSYKNTRTSEAVILNDFQDELLGRITIKDKKIKGQEIDDHENVK